MSYIESFRAYELQGVPMRGQMIAQFTGTVAAALASGGTIFTYRYPEAGTGHLLVQRMFLHTTFITATVAIEAGRALRIVRGVPDAPGTSNPSGGTAGAVIRKNGGGNEMLGVARLADTGALTTTGFTFDTGHVGQLPLIPVKGIGTQDIRLFTFDGIESDPVYLRPGELIAVQAAQAFPAAGTFQLYAELHAVEVA